MSNQAKFDEILLLNSAYVSVIAGPGSGKTKGVLIPRIKKLLEDSIDSKKILILTFSRASAQDLLSRFASDNEIPRISTLHSFCLSFLLSENNHSIRKRVDSIIIDFEYESLVSDLKYALPHLHKRDIIKLIKEFSAGWARLPHDQVFSENEDRKKFKGLIINWLDEYGAAMMEEIVYEAVDLARKIESPFIDGPEYISVDEYQDLNKLEQEFVDLIAKKSKLLLVLGDPDQSIYSFKYAHPDGIISFSRRKNVDSHSLEYIGRSAKKIVAFANEILKQADPLRTNFLKPLQGNEEGQVKISKFNTQGEEFKAVFDSIDKIIESGEEPNEILLLVPRKKLGVEYIKNINQYLVNKTYSYCISSKIDFSTIEREKILLLSLLANPKSLLHIRSYIGLNDSNNYAKEVNMINAKYGNLEVALNNADPNDFNSRERKVKLLCNKLIELKYFLSSHANQEDLKKIIDELFPESAIELNEVRNLIISLKDDGDNVTTLYSKLIDYMRTISSSKNQVKIMTLLSSKGLEANHVFIIGCNDGNIPGTNRSVYLDDHAYKQEQRRLLYVGATRAKKSLTITWCQHIPFEQAMGHLTSGVGVRTVNGKKFSRVSISEFLQDISGFE